MKIRSSPFSPLDVCPFTLHRNKFSWVARVLRIWLWQSSPEVDTHVFETHSESLSSFGFVLVIFRVDKFILQEQNRAFLGFDFWLRFRKFCSVESWRVSHWGTSELSLHRGFLQHWSGFIDPALGARPPCHCPASMQMSIWMCHCKPSSYPVLGQSKSRDFIVPAKDISSRL